MTSFIVLGIIFALNAILVLWKLSTPGRRLNGVLDCALLIGACMITSRSTDLMIIGIIGSLCISLYLTLPSKYRGGNNVSTQ